MNTKVSKSIIFTAIAISFVVGAYVYDRVPDQIASHWNAQGEVDGYLSKFWGLFLMPFVLVFMYGMYVLIPKIDPLRKNIESFRRQYNALIVLIVLFLFYLYLLTILWNVGMRFDMGRAIIPAIGVLFFYIGVILRYAKRNWFVGIRTPWTLSSDIVWNKTHALGSTLFKVAGIIALLSIFFPRYSFVMTIVPILLFTLYLVVYSYSVFYKEEKSHD